MQLRFRHTHRLRHWQTPSRLAAADVADGLMPPHASRRRHAVDLVSLQCAHVGLAGRPGRLAVFAARQLAKLCLLATVASAQRPTPDPAPWIARLAGGDSALVLSMTPMRSGPGHTVYVRYHPYRSLGDSVATRRGAVELWRYLRPWLDRAAADHVLLQATSGDGMLGGLFDHNVAFVLVQRSDKRWYFQHESVALDDR